MPTGRDIINLYGRFRVYWDSVYGDIPCRTLDADEYLRHISLWETRNPKINRTYIEENPIEIELFEPVEVP